MMYCVDFASTRLRMHALVAQFAYVTRDPGICLNVELQGVRFLRNQFPRIRAPRNPRCLESVPQNPFPRIRFPQSSGCIVILQYNLGF